MYQEDIKKYITIEKILYRFAYALIYNNNVKKMFHPRINFVLYV